MATHLGMEVLGYDPFISVEGAWSLSRSVKHCVNLSDIIAQCDYITLHLPVNAETKGFIHANIIAQMQPGVRILNFARGELIDTPAMVNALKTGHVACYVSDFPNEALLAAEGAVCLPHLGASTPESEDNCAVMAAAQMKDFLLNGNIKNSVNFPAVSMPRSGGSRICVVHSNIPGTLAAITDVTGKAKLNIENMTNKSRGNYAYTILDINGSVSEEQAANLLAVEGIIRVRVV